MPELPLEPPDAPGVVSMLEPEPPIELPEEPEVVSREEPDWPLAPLERRCFSLVEPERDGSEAPEVEESVAPVPVLMSLEPEPDDEPEP